MTEQSAAPNMGNKNHNTNIPIKVSNYHCNLAVSMRFQVVMFLSVLLIDLVKTLPTSGEED